MKRCVNDECGLCWLDPVAIEADLQYLYENYYTHGERVSVSGFRAKARYFLLSAYEFAKLLPSSVLGLSQERRQISNMFLEDLHPGRVLDVGCGTGGFLFRMHQSGWSVTGVDFDGKAIANAKAKYGFELLHSDLAGARFPDNSFDAVTMHHVIEHVPEPVALGNCARQASFKTVEVKSSAANADAVIGASFGIRQAKKQMTCSQAVYEINMMRALRSCFIQYREALLLRKQLNCGEEAVLICHK